MRPAATTPRTFAPRALLPLARGLLAHPANRRLRARLGCFPEAAASFYRDVQFLFFRLAFLLRAGRGELRATSPELMRTPSGDVIAGLANCRLQARDLNSVLDILFGTPLDLAGLYQELLPLRPRIDLAER